MPHQNSITKKIFLNIDSGNVEFDGYLVTGSVSFIVYEMDDGDVRKVMDFSSKTELAARINSLSVKLKSLHDVSVGISQLHNNDISHQDIKPSNILSFKGESKIGDLNYAAPECFFPNYSPSKEALYQVDNYMLGGLVTFQTIISFYAYGKENHILMCSPI